MISGGDLYTVLTAVVPLYVAMFLAYGSVRWWNIFTPDQCSGINRFVAVFAVPLLSFHFISSNDPYSMNFRFMAADTLQKIIVLTVLSFWLKFNRNGSLEWFISIFSLSTLPNTLVMGIPLLIAMYGPYSGTLMVQVVVLQCIIWYTLLLFFFEYRGAMFLLLDQFPHTAASITSLKIDPDVVSLDCHDFLETETEFGPDGKLHVTLRKSNVSRRSFATAITPRHSNLTGVEIYSLNSSRNPTPRESTVNHSDLYAMDGRLSCFTPGDMYSLHSSRPQTPRASNFEDHNIDHSAHHTAFQTVLSQHPAPNHDQGQSRRSERRVSVEYGRVSVEKKGGEKETVGEEVDVEGQKVRNNNNSEGHSMMNLSLRKEYVSSEEESSKNTVRKMPPARVMTRLILIMVWRKLIRNPNTYSSLIGLIWSLISFRFHAGMPKIAAQSISILSDAGLGMAMFSLGLFMALQPKIIACGNQLTGFSMLVRFVMGPAVMAVASLAVGLRGTLLRIAIVQAALPQGIVPFVFAKEYNVHPAILSTAVIFGMLVALPITILCYFLLEI